MEEAQTHSQETTARPKILFADDHRIVLDALSFMAGDRYDVRVVESFAALEQEVDRFAPDLVVLDVSMPDGDGFEVAKRLAVRPKPPKVMFLSMHSEPRYIKLAKEAGAQGYVSKRAPADELQTAIRTVLEGGSYVGASTESAAAENGAALTERQFEVLRLISHGLSAKEIAERLNISVRTAEFHRAAIMDRLKLHSTAMMTRYAIEHGIV